MSSVAVPAPRRRRSAPLALGISTAYLSLIVLIPLAALTLRSLEGGLSAFWEAVTDPQAVAALKLTFVVSLAVVAINAVAGTLVATDSWPGDRADQSPLAQNTVNLDLMRGNTWFPLQLPYRASLLGG